MDVIERIKADNLYPSTELQDMQSSNIGNMANNLRITKIDKILEKMKEELEKRELLRKKYRKSINIIDGIDVGLSVTSLGGSVSSIVLLTAIANPPIAIVAGGVALSVSAMKLGTDLLLRKLRQKEQKHREIKVLAESKINSIEEIVSAAISNGNVDEAEFKSVLEEERRFLDLKKLITRDFKKRYQNMKMLSLEEKNKVKKEIFQELLGKKS